MAAKKPTFRTHCIKYRTALKRHIRRLARPKRNKLWYLRGSLVVLFATTIFWASLGALLHSTNADQLVDSYLFNDTASFNGARFPSTHSMLFKWPLFWLTTLIDSTAVPLIVATVAVSVATVGALAWMLSRIEKRPLVLGTWYLALASMLLLVPLQAYSGGLLPVHMAMLTTRNLEYIAYIAGIALVLRSNRWRSPALLFGVLLLTVLSMSDRLFVALGLGSALLMLLLGAIRHNRLLILPAIRLTVCMTVAGVATALLPVLSHLLGASQLTASDASPYQLIHTVSGGIVGLLYGGLGVITNFGANPAFDALTISTLLSKGLSRLFAFSGLPYLMNASLAGFIAWQSVKLIRQVPKPPAKRTKKTYPLAPLISLALLCSALVALGLFVITDHYYAVDARYLTIWFFAGIIAAVTALHVQPLQREHVVTAGLAITVLLPLTIMAAWNNYRAQTAAFAPFHTRDQRVVSLLDQHNVSTLVGDYWRVMPIRSASKTPLTVAPLGSCTTFRDNLTSTSWQQDLDHKRVALLLSLEKGLTDFPACTKAETVAHFGEPSSIIFVAGTSTAPTELLLIYDRGFRHSSAVPLLVNEPRSTCQSKTIVQVAAHPDDDLLFFSPDLLRDMRSGACVRTIYVTAGDSGADQQYWHERQAGIRDAYNYMLGQDYAWDGRKLELSDGHRIQIDIPAGNNRVALIFMNIPDGGPGGAGFTATGNQSLQQLLEQALPAIQTIDSPTTYTAAQLTAALTQIFHHYAPAEVRTFAISTPDHSDHAAVATFVAAAVKSYQKPLPLQSYIGYAVYGLEANVEGDDFAQKQAAFMRYTTHDPATCRDTETCFSDSVYGLYLSRQYRPE